MSGHDDLRFDDDLDPAELALAARLARTFAGQAGTIVLPDEPFDPTRPVTLEPLATEPEGRPGRGWIVWIAGAAAAAVLVAAIVAINAVRQPSLEVGDHPAPPLVGPDAAWAPTWVPDGLVLWRVDAAEGDAATVLPAETDPAFQLPVTQLFESSAGARVLLSIGALDEHTASDGTRTTIRGIEGTTRADVRGAGGSSAGTRFEWNEAGRTFSALVATPDTDAAAALLDGLVFAAPDDPSGGFAPPADAAWTVRTEDLRSLPQGPVIVARFGYDTTRPDDGGSELEVLTAPAGPAGSALGGYLTTAYRGSIGEDGVAVWFEPGDGDRPAQSSTVWPDGRRVAIQGVGLDEATADEVARGVEPIGSAALQALIDEASARLGEGEVLAAADLPSGRVEVIGSPSADAVCLTAGGRRSCKGLEARSGIGVPLLGSVLVDGSWLLFAAVDGGLVSFHADPESSTPQGDPTTTRPDPGAGVGNAGTTPGTAMPGSVGPFETTVAGSWTLAVYAAPQEATTVTIATTGRSATFFRPTF